jgi:hypothetical protein
VGNTQQLTVSPPDGSYNWSSEDQSIAKVSATGLVEATGEGTTDIIVNSGDIYTRVKVTATRWITLTDIAGIPESLNLFQGGQANVMAIPVPINASEVSFTWMSENPEVVNVTSGKLEAVGRGTTYIVVSSGDIQKRFLVNSSGQLDRSNWRVIAVSDEKASDGGGKDAIIDDVLTTYWHSQWGPDIPLPHWAIIDMEKSHTITRIITYRSPIHTHTKTVHYLIGDSPEPDAPGWREFISGVFVSNPLTLDIPSTENTQGRYLKIYMDDSSNGGPHTQIAEIYVYGTD